MENSMPLVFRDLMIVLLALVLLWASAFGVSLIQSYFQEEMHAAAYGTPLRYADDQLLIQAMLWVGKEGSTPYDVPDGRTPTGDFIGNSGSYNLRMIRTQVEQPSISWNKWISELNNVTYFSEPILTITNTRGGVIRAVYKAAHEGALVYSVDKTRVPDPDPLHRLDIDVWENGGDHVELQEYMVLRITMPSYTSTNKELFSSLYPECTNVMAGVYRDVGISHLYLYAMHPTETNQVIAEADIRFLHYSVWKQQDGSPINDNQKLCLIELDIPNAAYCTAEMSEYKPHLIIE